jgi:hypothetical protein
MISTEINPYMSQNTVTIAVPAEEEQWQFPVSSSDYNWHDTISPMPLPLGLKLCSHISSSVMMRAGKLFPSASNRAKSSKETLYCCSGRESVSCRGTLHVGQLLQYCAHTCFLSVQLEWQLF